jgi:site-specific DNA-cytosine methylase
MKTALCIDLFSGLGGWTEGFLSEGYEVIGFDIQDFPSYPGELVVGDVKVLARDIEEMHLSGWYGRLRSAIIIVASPPWRGIQPP